MGDVRRLLLTGATGFVGRAVLAEARARGIDVTAVTRGEAPAEWASDSGITALRADLSDPGCVAPLRAAMADAQAVIHAAAHMGGDPDAHSRDTLKPTSHLLQAMEGSDATLVLVSSIAVFDSSAVDPGDRITESSPLEQAGRHRDAYSEAKCGQETLVRDARQAAWLMRPGAIYGAGRTWHALLGFWVSRLFIAVTSDGELPVTRVDRTAWALVEAATTPPDGIEALIVVDDDRPTRARFITAHRAATGWPRAVLPVPYGVWLGMARLLRPVARHLPGLFREPVIRARLMPQRFSNAALRARLGGADPAPFEQMLADAAERAAP